MYFTELKGFSPVYFHLSSTRKKKKKKIEKRRY